MGNSNKVLVVEDDFSVRITLAEILKMYEYICETADNGAEGFEKALEFKPDIILSDVNMPILNGYELAEKIKNTRDIAHIPIIMLTANTTEEQKLEGLGSGAVDYISKPFNSKELVLKIGNIIATRQQLENNSWHNILAGTYKDIPNLDEQFVEDLYETIVTNIALSDYPATVIAQDLGMSERSLYRKVKENLNQSVSGFIKEVKLQHAHKLLTEKKVQTLSEAASRIGFKSARHFSKLYRARFDRD